MVNSSKKLSYLFHGRQGSTVITPYREAFKINIKTNILQRYYSQCFFLLLNVIINDF